MALPKAHVIFATGFSLFQAFMNPDVEALILCTLAEAQAAGKDYLTQTEIAVRAVRDRGCASRAGNQTYRGGEQARTSAYPGG